MSPSYWCVETFELRCIFVVKTHWLRLRERQTTVHQLSRLPPVSLGLKTADLNWRKNNKKKKDKNAVVRRHQSWNVCILYIKRGKKTRLLSSHSPCEHPRRAGMDARTSVREPLILKRYTEEWRTPPSRDVPIYSSHAVPSRIQH